MYQYVSTTWLIANLVHPFMLFIVFGGAEMTDMFQVGLQWALYSLLFSLPSLFLGFLAIYGISRLSISDGGKYMSWLITAPVIVFINYWLLFVVFFKVSLEREDSDFMLPAMLSVIFTILIRYASFFKAAAQLNKEKNNTDLNDPNEFN